MMANEPFAPYDQNKPSKPQIKYCQTTKTCQDHIKGIYSQESIHVTFFQNISINHGYEARLSRAKPN
jgi:hypothetical protein